MPGLGPCITPRIRVANARTGAWSSGRFASPPPSATPGRSRGFRGRSYVGARHGGPHRLSPGGVPDRRASRRPPKPPSDAAVRESAGHCGGPQHRRGLAGCGIAGHRGSPEAFGLAGRGSRRRMRQRGNRRDIAAAPEAPDLGVPDTRHRGEPRGLRRVRARGREASRQPPRPPALAACGIAGHRGDANAWRGAAAQDREASRQLPKPPAWRGAAGPSIRGTPARKSSREPSSLWYRLTGD